MIAKLIPSRRNFKTLSPLIRNDRGISMVEMAVVGTIFVFLILAFFDLARYVALQTVLTKGAQEGLNVAIKAPNIDLQDVGNTSFQTARNIVVDTATAFPETTIVSLPNTGRAQELINYNPVNPTDPVDSLHRKAILIRPGESYTVDGTSTVIAHPTHPTLSPGETQKQLLKDHPLVVEVRSNLKLFSPFLQDIVVTGQAVGFRENAAQAGPGQGGVPTTTTTTTTTITTTTLAPPTTTTSTTTTTTTSTTTTTGPTTTTTTVTTTTGPTTTTTTTTTTTGPSTTTSTTTSTTSTTGPTTTTTSTTTTTGPTTTTITTTTTTVTTTSTTTTTTSTTTTTTTTSITTTTRRPRGGL